jgi:fermentation-respiration switch protein FrsA (DUF1100 family)
MNYLWIGLSVLAALALIVALIAYICFRMAFYVPKKRPVPEEYPVPDGDEYLPYREQMIQWIKESRALPHEDVQITSFDGLVLRGRYYEYAPGAPIELMLHGYRGESERDMSGGVQRCFALGRSALVVDQRSCGRSEGTVITFGAKEHKDCLYWVEYMVKRFGPDVKIILTGISMGAATVVMASGCDLPNNVIGVLADCGCSSAKQIIKLVIRNRIGLPPDLAYPFVRLGAKLFGGFDPDTASPVDYIKNTKVPVIFYHGDADDFVPSYMSQDMFDACPSRKELVIIPGAAHGLSFPKDPDTYLRTLSAFFGPDGSAK